MWYRSTRKVADGVAAHSSYSSVRGWLASNGEHLVLCKYMYSE